MALLRDLGGDPGLKHLESLVLKYQTANWGFYHSLWQTAAETGSPRVAGVLAIVLRDRRILVDQTRSCDAALVALEKAVSQRFSSGGRTIQERDEAVSRALAWLESHGHLN